MTNEFIEPIVIRIIQDILKVPVTIDVEMGDIREWDSMAQLSILINIEKELNYRFQLEEIVNAVSVKKWVEVAMLKETTNRNHK